jgi:hypothetical protein
VQPIRADIHTAVEYPEKPVNMTLREAIEWWKECVRAGQAIGSVNVMEEKYLNERWAGLVEELAHREKVPVGALSYFLGELAQAEMRAIEVAQEALFDV